MASTNSRSSSEFKYANGLIPNDRTHSLKAYGFYDLTPNGLLAQTSWLHLAVLKTALVIILQLIQTMTMVPFISTAMVNQHRVVQTVTCHGIYAWI
jgi:hypothetical protein